MNRREVLKQLGAAGTLSALAPSALVDSPEPLRNASAANPPNIVLLFADDLGYGDLSSFGHPTIRTPNLDQVGRDGMRLTSFYASAPGCSPSRAALLTGRYQTRVGIPRVLFPFIDNGMPDREVTLAEALKDAGYRTQMIGKWHLGDKERYLPTNHGFDHFFGTPYSHDIQQPWVPRVEQDVPLLRDTEVVERPINFSTLTTRYTGEAVDFIESSAGGDDPFFLYLPYNMPHLPLATPERFRGRSRGGFYGDVVEMLDWSAGRLLKTLEAQEIADNTIFIFTSDNGPWLNLPDRTLQGGNERQHVGSPGLLRGAKGNTHEAGLRVPAIIKWPNQIPAGQVSADIATTMDLYPSLIEAAGGSVPTDRPIDGNNLLPFLCGEDDSPTERFFYHQGPQVEAVREGSWKLRIQQNNKGESDPPELYNLDRDPSERYNRAEALPNQVTRLKEQMRALADEIDIARVNF